MVVRAEFIHEKTMLRLEWRLNREVLQLGSSAINAQRSTPKAFASRRLNSESLREQAVQVSVQREQHYDHLDQIPRCSVACTDPPVKMRSFHLKIAEREEEVFTETEVAQMFADGRVDRNTPCKPSDRGDWKTIDDYLPMLKYGTQLPPASKVPPIPPAPPPVILSSQRVSVIDFDIPFGSVLKIMFKWMAAGLVVFCCFLPVIFVLWLIVAAIFAALFNGVMSTFHHP